MKENKGFTNKKVILSILTVIVLLATVTGYILLTQSEKQEQDMIVQQEKKDFTISEKLEIMVDESKSIEITEGDLNQMLFEIKDNTIALVDEKGVITGIKVGETKVVVSLADQQKICEVIIIEKEIASTVTNEKEKIDSKRPDSTTAAKKKSTPSSSTNNTTSNQTTKPTISGDDSADNAKSETQIEEPKSNVTYSYRGKEAFDWVLNEGGEVLSNGKAYLMNPLTPDNTLTILDYIVNVENVGKPDCDYIVTAKGVLDANSYMVNCLDKLLPDGVGLEIEDRIYNKYQTSFTVNGRNYKTWQSRFGNHIQVSAKEN